MPFEQTCIHAITWSMNLSTDLRRGRCCVFLMHVHLVFVTKYRGNVFTKNILEELRHMQRLWRRMSGIRRGKRSCASARKLPSKIVNSLKGVSSRWIRKSNYPTVQQALWGDSLWSPSYFAGACGGAPLEIIRQYIEQQGSPAI